MNVPIYLLKKQKEFSANIPRNDNKINKSFEYLEKVNVQKVYYYNTFLYKAFLN